MDSENYVINYTELNTRDKDSQRCWIASQ